MDWLYQQTEQDTKGLRNPPNGPLAPEEGQRPYSNNHVEAGTLELKYVPLHKNLADIMTKGLLCQLHQDLANGLGLLPVQGGVL